MPKKEEKAKREAFEPLLDSSKKLGTAERARLLESMNVKEFFEEGTISINDRTCQGLECELCIKACPTKALYWRDGKVGIIKDLCVYCGACVVCCIVDDCVKVRRKRSDGKVERFSKPREVVCLFNDINSKKRRGRVETIFPSPEHYLKRCRKS